MVGSVPQVPAAEGSETVPIGTVVGGVVVAAAPVVVVELDDELPHAANPRPAAATKTRVKVRTRVMWGNSFRWCPGPDADSALTD